MTDERNLRFEGDAVSKALNHDLTDLLTNRTGFETATLTLSCEPTEWNETAVSFLDGVSHAEPEESPEPEPEPAESDGPHEYTWDRNDDGYRRVKAADGHIRTVSPDTRLYQGLSLAIVAVKEVGPPVSVHDLLDVAKCDVPEGAIGAGLTHLRRVGLVADVTGKKRGLEYIPTAAGVEYIREHGAPERECPSAVVLDEAQKSLSEWSLYE